MDYDYVHDELQRDGVTLLTLWEDYRNHAIANGMVPKSYTTFCKIYCGCVASHNVTNHLEHRPVRSWKSTGRGDDATRNRLHGEIAKAHLFVATLPYSQYSYVEAMLDMRQNAWILCHVHA